MRADTPTGLAAGGHTLAASGNERRPSDFVVAPMYVRDLNSAFAAYFLDWFATLAPELILDVMKCGLREGGLPDEVEHFKFQCESDIESEDNDLGYWPIEDNGPWIYGNVAVAEVSAAVFEHTVGWSIDEFGFYGYTVKEISDIDKHLASLSETLPKRG